MAGGSHGSPGSPVCPGSPVRAPVLPPGGGTTPRRQAGAAPEAPAALAVKPGARPADDAPVTPPLRQVSRPLLALPAAVVAWTRSPASTPWRGDLLRSALAPAVLGAAALAPYRPVPLTAALLVAGAYLLLVLAAALGRLDAGVRVPGGVLLVLDALHLLWGAHLTAGLGGAVPVVLATAACCLVLRLALLPPVAPRPAPAADPARARSRASARTCPSCPHGRGHRAEGERLLLARADA